MRHNRMFAILLAALAGETAAVSAHITPVVVLRRQADVIRDTLTRATSYAVTTVTIGKPELQQIAERGHFTPNVGQVKFYRGATATGASAGVVLFPQVDTQHGPVEVGLTIGPSGTVTSVMVTRATVETKAWIRDVERSGLLQHFVGLRPGEDPQRAVAGAESDLGAMPIYMADTIASAVQHGLVLYDVLERRATGSAP